MDKIIDYISTRLKDHHIDTNVEAQVGRLFTEQKISADTSLDASYAAFLESMDHPVYNSLLSGTRPFDIRIVFKTLKGCLGDLKERIDKKIRNEYSFLCDGFLGVKLYKERYEYGKTVPSCAVPFLRTYRAVRKSICFEEVEFMDMVFEVKESCEPQKHTELVEHLRSIGLPLNIIDDELVNGKGLEGPGECNECILELEDREWPEDSDAVSCAKAALYCFIYRRSPYRHLVFKDAVVLRYKNSMFIIRINSQDDVLRSFRTIVGQRCAAWKENVRMVKKFLGFHGFYPMQYDDYLVEIMCLCINEYHLSSFFDEFVKSRFDFDKTLSLDTLAFEPSEGLFMRQGKRRVRIRVPENTVRKRLSLLCGHFINRKFKLFDPEFNLLSDKFLIPNIKNYDFCTSQFRRVGFKYVLCKKKNFIVTLEAEKLKHLGFFFYSIPLRLLMVKCKKGIDPQLLCSIVLVKMTFEYVRMIS